MGRKKRHSGEQVIGMLREAEVLSSQGHDTEAICKHLGITDVTYYRWRKKYGGMKLDSAKRLREAEKENARLRKLVADLSLDNEILKEANRGNF